jgi:hypothetical protein
MLKLMLVLIMAIGDSVVGGWILTDSESTMS